MVKFILRSLFFIFAVSIIAAFLLPPAKNAPKPQAEKKTNDKDKKMDLGLVAGYTDGKDMASKGMVKPSAEVVDALARRRYAEMKEFGADAAFKQNYKTAFWEGWRAGD
jgi:Na+-transporting NADH:ubiquinone oxidoreductase subunit NqrC